MADHDTHDHTGVPGVGGPVLKRTVLNGGGNLTTTSATKTPLDSTNLAYLTFSLAIGDLVRCTLCISIRDASASNASGWDFEVDQPTSANTYIGAGSDYGVGQIKAPGSGEGRRLITPIGIFTATEAGTHGFRPVWLTDGDTLTGCNASSGGDDCLITFIVEKLGPSA